MNTLNGLSESFPLMDGDFELYGSEKEKWQESDLGQHDPGKLK